MASSQRRRVLAGSIFGSLWMVGLALPPFLLSRAIDGFLAGDSLGVLALWAAALIGAGALVAWLAISRHRTMSQVRIEGNFQVSQHLVRQATRLGTSLNRHMSAGELATLGLSDVTAASTSLTVTGPGVGAVVAYVVVGVLLLQVSWLLALIVLLGIPVLVIVVGPLMQRLIASQDSYRAEQGDLTAQLVDAISGLRVLNAFGGKAHYRSRFAESSERLRERGYGVASVVSWINAVAVGLPAVFLGAVVWLAARMVAQGDISPGELVAVYGYTAVLVVPVSQFIEGADQVGRGVVGARRIIPFLSAQPVVVATGPIDAAPPAAAVLQDPQSSVALPPHSMVGIVCHATADAVGVVDRLGGIEASQASWGELHLQDCALQHVRNRVLVAEPDSAIFTGTFRTVIQGNRTGADDGAIRAAVHVAAAEDVLTSVGGDLDGLVHPGGANLSGGERQRIRLARAVLQEREALLLVEPTSALDAHTEKVVAERLRRERGELQTLVTTTSPLVLSQLDIVFFIEDGRVVRSGTHHELMQDPSYRRLVSRGVDDVGPEDR